MTFILRKNDMKSNSLINGTILPKKSGKFKYCYNDIYYNYDHNDGKMNKYKNYFRKYISIGPSLLFYGHDKYDLTNLVNLKGRSDDKIKSLLEKTRFSNFRGIYNYLHYYSNDIMKYNHLQFISKDKT